MRKLLIRFFISFILVSTGCSYSWAQDKTAKYKGLVDLESGVAYNFNTAQLISTNNMQIMSFISSIHGVEIKNWFVGVGVGYYHSFRDSENIYSLFGASRVYPFRKNDKILLELRLGCLYDPYWVARFQCYGSFGCGYYVLNNLQLGLRGSIFSCPSRFFYV